MEAREYQENAANAILAEGNSLLVMPTAMGKTFVAAIVMKKLGGKQLFLVPTKPLAVQQARRLEELVGKKTLLVTGEVSPAVRTESYGTAELIVATPQCIENDLLARRIRLQDFRLVVFDEAHRAVGDYAYVFIGAQAKAAGCFILGLTASPSSVKQKILDVCENLGVKHVEVKNEDDEDARKYAKEVLLEWEFVDLPPQLVTLCERLRHLLSEALQELKDYGFFPSADLKKANKSTLLALRGPILAQTPNAIAYKALSSQARALNIVHAIDLLESQGVAAFVDFLDGMQTRDKKSKAVQKLLADPLVAIIKRDALAAIKEGVEHPKLPKLREIVAHAAAEGKSSIVFAHYRSSVDEIERELNLLPGVKARQLVGRGNEGMTQKQQAAAIDAFRAGDFNALVATSVGEEGLDIPSVDLVVFFEAVPSEIRLIQRRGRAGRVKAGNVVVLVTRDTKDEGFLWISRRKEKEMHRVLRTVEGDFKAGAKQETLGGAP